MTRKIILFLCLSIGFGSMWLDNSHSGEPGEETIEFESGLYYTIEKGDTLWDISEHFHDYAWIWPDLWERNQQIANPHWIYPGELIRLFSREELETLEKMILQSETEAGPDGGAGPEGAGPARAIQPLGSPYYLYSAIDSVGFIRKKPVSPSGTIFKVKEDKRLVSQHDLVYIRPTGNTIFEPGDLFTVFRTLKTVRDKETKAIVGVQHYILGVVEITEVKPKFAIGRITESYRHIALNDLLMPYEARSPKILLTESIEGLKGKIIITEEHESVFADTVVFIDKGRQEGVKVGQSYSVYYQEKSENILLPPVDFGKLLVLRTEETTATALVTMAEKGIEPGATIRAPNP